ncbi:MAG: bi-domain-containing oxidoreductase [Polyangiaceae bacterium]|nr:bi-domain-containing oxidoreductase [Polyangiaceae bacterium]
MKVVLQSLGSGQTEVVEAPAPQVRAGTVLIANEASLISAGTERMLVEFGRASLFEKARQQPEKVRQVLDKVRTDGLMSAVEAVRSKLDDPIPLGYSACGRVLALGDGVTDLRVGDRVVSNGYHAEVVCVPKHLCAKVPEGLPPEQAAFTVVGAIALQGIRLVSPTLGEVMVVTGLGLIGLITVQLLRASGCQVIGIDPSAERRELARRFGARTVEVGEGIDPVGAVEGLTSGRGVDAVIITASTKSSEPVSQAARMCRKRGRIVLVGVTGLELRRADFYERELTFQVSCSYGPGRYDPRYEEQGQDYPLGYVRWTEQRNFEAVLGALASGQLDVAPLISGEYPIEDAAAAYGRLAGDPPTLGLLLRYSPPEIREGQTAGIERTVLVSPPKPHRSPTQRPTHPVIGFIGAGNYASRLLIPAFAKTPARLKWVATTSGISAAKAARRHGIELATSDVDRLFDDPEVNTIVIATRHDTHARLTCRALRAGKHVFVEKPLGITEAEIDEVEAAYADAASGGDAPQLMVGYNRRFAPLVVKLKALLAGRIDPKAIVITVNAGAIPAEHWTQSPTVGGGRIVGEACHFVDLARHLVGSSITDFSVFRARCARDPIEDVGSIALCFADGSIATVHYLANGNRAYPKERIEVFVGGGVYQIDNFRTLRAWGCRGSGGGPALRQDKGQAACAGAFVRALATDMPAVSIGELLETSRWMVFSSVVATAVTGNKRDQLNELGESSEK